jgi:hypothetical protein
MNKNLDQYLDVSFLRATAEHVPHWFGLGFIQLKLNHVQRIHFWHPGLVADLPDEELHDHRYNFTSYLLKGKLTNEVWQFVPADSGTLELVTVSCKPGASQEPVSINRGFTTMLASHTMHQGDHYRMHMDTLHRIRASHAITLLEREAVVKDLARVVRNPAMPFVCPFAAPKPVNELWELIRECIENDSN